MKGDPEGYGEFFSQPVLVTTEEVIRFQTMARQ